VTGGGVSIDGDWWVGSRPDFFLPVPVLKKLFRGKVLAAIKAAAASGDLPTSHLPAFGRLYRKSWVVYCKPPFGSPEQVLAYLARYTHRVAISNQRLVRLEGEEVTFTWKDYADHDRIREGMDAVLAGEPVEFGRLRFTVTGGHGPLGSEGTFLACTFWLVENLALLGDLGKARSLFDRARRCANDVGLFAEEVDARSGELLGNFPQAFSHIGLINAAWAISEAEARATAG
jgi:hypothetical protein